MAKFYTGVGSRKTPVNILKIMEKLASKLSGLGYVLRSGGAAGADSAFERGADKAEIFYAKHASDQAMDIAKKFHPAWNRCSEFARKLHGRNSYQVLGRNLVQPSTFLVCWTPDGACSHAERNIRTGGTGTAISIAEYYKVPVFNLARQEYLQRIIDFINQ